MCSCYIWESKGLLDHDPIDPPSRGALAESQTNPGYKLYLVQCQYGRGESLLRPWFQALLNSVQHYHDF